MGLASGIKNSIQVEWSHRLMSGLRGIKQLIQFKSWETFALSTTFAGSFLLFFH